MPLLTINNGFTCQLPTLGRIVPFGSLSEKRITKAVRERLRQRYGESNVEVSCTAKFDGTGWNGACVIDGQPFRYRITI